MKNFTLAVVLSSLVAIGIALFAFAAQATTIDIDTRTRTLTLTDDVGVKKTYRVAVGTPDEQWVGTQVVTRKREWPEWRPTADTLRKHPNLKPVVAGGPKNPLGARALYLGQTVYRIHGTNQPKSIGKAASGGCFRMRNADVIDLYPRVPVGTVVTVR